MQQTETGCKRGKYAVGAPSCHPGALDLLVGGLRFRVSGLGVERFWV